MNQSFPCSLVGMGLSNLPSNLKFHITFDLKILYAKKLPCQKLHSIPYSQLKFQKITAILDASSKVTKSGQNHFGDHSLLGVNLVWY
jgi:hypothetical protein